jgi:voltage-gated potassium channel
MFIQIKSKQMQKIIQASLLSHSIKAQLVRLSFVLITILASHIICMMWLENMPLMDAVWVTMTTATTVGYGDISAKTTEGRLATIFLMYVGGIAVLAQVAALYFELRREKKELMIKGEWRWNMQNHIVFLNCPDEAGEEYFYQGISQLRMSSESMAEESIIIVTQKFKDGLPDRLRKLNVVHVNKSVSDPELFEVADLKDAGTIIVMSPKQLDPISDSINFELVDRLREQGIKARIIVETVRDENRQRLKKAGADNVLRPIRSYPELLMRAILAPGSEQIIEALFDSFGEECIRYDVKAKVQWLQVIQSLALNDIGLPIAYESAEGKIVTNPPPKQNVSMKAVFVIVREQNLKQDSEVEKAILANV